MSSNDSTLSITKQYYNLAILSISLPYLSMLLFVNSSLQLIAPCIIGIVMMSLGYHTKVLPIFKYRLKPFLVSSPSSIFVTIGIILAVELLSARNLPLIGLFFGPYVDHTDYGLPILHSLFNSLCLWYVVSVFTIPTILRNTVQKSKVVNSLFLVAFVGFTLQRLPFLILLLAFFLPSILSFLRIISSFLFRLKLALNPLRLAILLLIFSFSVSFLIVSGAFRNDLSSFNFQGLGTFSYTLPFRSLDIPSQVAAQYLFTPHLNSYINIHQYGYRDPYLLSTLFPYIAKYATMFFPDFKVDFFYLPNPVFNARSYLTLLYYLFPLGSFVYLLLFYCCGQIFSLPLRRLSFIPNSYAISDIILSDQLFNSTIVVIGLILSFFIPWWSYPVIVIPILLNAFFTIDA